MVLCAMMPVLAGMTACDLQPKIMSLPDSVGDFISSRYPALLADPNTQPEIYNSAASDYGIYASPELYGSVSSDDYILYSDINDYMFPAQPAPQTMPVASDVADSGVADVDAGAADDAPTVVQPGPDDIPDMPTDDVLVIPMYGGVRDVHTITVARGDTLYAIAGRYGATVDELAAMNNMSAPYNLTVGQTLTVPGNGDIKVAPKTAVVSEATRAAPISKLAQQATKQETVPAAVRTATPARVELQTITVGAGDTLYSLSRKYSVPVNDLAVMNDLGVPFVLTVGQRLKVPNLRSAVVKTQAANAVATSNVAAPRVTTPVTTVPVGAKPVATVGGKPVAKTVETGAAEKTAPKADSKPKNADKKDTGKKAVAAKKKQPAISPRSASKFSWPVRGKILSAFGTKPNGLVNDGINIAATRGTPVAAAENGVVAYAGNELRGMGNLIILQHADGWMTVYAHLDSMSVRRGARVNVGQKIGSVGTTGKVDRPQLHFEIRKGTKPYNPSAYLKK